MNQAELLESLNTLNAAVAKVGTETEALIAEVAALKDAPNVFAAINAVVATLVIPLLRVIKQFPTGFEETQPMKDDA
jgi:hypothetical protein